MGAKKKSLVDLRQEAGLTQEALATMLGVDHVTVWRWEKNDRQPSLYQLQPLAESLRCRIEDIVTAFPAKPRKGTKRKARAR